MDAQNYKKLENLTELDLLANLNLVNKQILAWHQAKPDNQALKDMVSAMVKISLIINKYTLERESYNTALNEYRATSTRSTMRARKAEDQIKALEEEISIYRKKEQLGL